MPCHAMPYHAMPCHAIPCHNMPCHTVPYHTMPPCPCLLRLIPFLPAALPSPARVPPDCTPSQPPMSFGYSNPPHATPSRPIPTHPTPTHRIPSHPVSSCPIPSHPLNTSHACPLSPILSASLPLAACRWLPPLDPAHPWHGRRWNWRWSGVPSRPKPTFQRRPRLRTIVRIALQSCR